ncbi:hypothetical protein ACFL7M_15715 [Thermodesulfobacteriota bacterium]
MIYKRLILLFIFMFFFTSYWGCTRIINVNIDNIGNLPIPLIEPLPLIAGVYYGNDFRTYKISQTKDTDPVVTLFYNAQLGKANIALFDYILSNLFEKVIPVQYLPNGNKEIENIDIIIEPTVDYYNPLMCLRYEIIFYLPNGKKISWMISGTVEDAPIILTSNTAKKHAQIAMRDVAAKFMTGFCNQEDIQKYFYKQCNR